MADALVTGGSGYLASDLIVPAREGTLRVLGAALDAGAERIVVTSSVAAVDRPKTEPAGRVLTEADWTDGGSDADYSLRPIQNDRRAGGLGACERMLDGEPAVPKLGFSLVDVRDIAQLHLQAMTNPDAGSSRSIGVARFAWMSEIASTLRQELGTDAKKVPRHTAPNFPIRAMGLFDGSIKSIIPNLGVKTEYSHDPATKVLGWKPRPVPESVVDCARSILVQNQ